MPGDSAGQPAPGPGVDAQGRAVIDPTENVKALTEAAVARLDDIADLRAKYTEKIEDLRAAHSTELRVADEKLRLAESARIDAIRAVDVGAVQRAAEVASAQAEALRLQVQAAATAAQTSLTAALDPIQKDIADLRRAQYEAQGQKTQIVETRATGDYRMTILAVVVTLIVTAIPLLVVLANKP
jgi:hypothetical protein